MSLKLKFNTRQKTVTLDADGEVELNELYRSIQDHVESLDGLALPDIVERSGGIELPDGSRTQVVMMFRGGWRLASRRPISIIKGLLAGVDERGKANNPIVEESRHRVLVGSASPLWKPSAHQIEDALLKVAIFGEDWFFDPDSGMIRRFHDAKKRVHSVQALYWFSKEEWKEDRALKGLPFPIEGDSREPKKGLERRYELKKPWKIPEEDRRFLSEGPLIWKGVEIVGPLRPPFLDHLKLVDFKCFDSLHVELSHKSSLPGSWTCIAGINGVGKSTILQAIALALLDSDFVGDLGHKRLSSFARSREKSAAAGHTYSVKLTGAVASEWSWPKQSLQPKHDLLVLGYGASRNLAEFNDNRFSSMAEDTQRLIGLFEPHAQVISAEVLLSQSKVNRDAIRFANELISCVLGDLISIVFAGNELRFLSEGQESGIEGLPDGYRTMLAWLSDLAISAFERLSLWKSEPKLEDIVAIVLVDELDLHLHPTLQRSIVPRLRSALPNVQWIVTTHSPLILSSFDRSELILLDRREEDGLRSIDRQILSFSADEVYRYLMGIEPSGAAMEQILDDPPEDLDPEVLLAQGFGKTPENQLNEEEAIARVAARRERRRRVLKIKS